MKLNQDFIDKVRDASSIIDAISNHTELKQAGDRYTGLCPFPDHTERTPSFSVSEGRQLYHCFGCKKSGNIFHFVQALQGLSFIETVEYLANKARIEMPKSSQDFSYNNSKEKMAYKINQLALNLYHKKLLSLPKSHSVRKYCDNRGLTKEIIEEFQLGYALEEWEVLYRYLKSQEVSLEVAEEIGILKRKKKDGHYDLFRNRLMFPIVTKAERVVGFGGRVLKDDHPKYINSSESLAFHKGQVLYGLNKSAKYIQSAGWTVVVEGYMDFLALYSQGIKNVVATLGTALTPYHARLLKRFSPRIVLLFDGDDAGLTAAQRSLPILLKEGLMPKAYFLPDKLDPDDFIKKYKSQALQERLKNASDLFTLTLQQLVKNLSGSLSQPSEKIHIMNQVAPILESVTNKDLKGLYIKDVADYLKVETNWVRNYSSSNLKNLSYNKQKKITSQASDLSSEMNKVIAEDQIERLDITQAPKAELYLLNLSLQNKSYWDEILNSGVVSEFSSPPLASLMGEIEEFLKKEESKFAKLPASLLDRLDENSRPLMSWYLEKPLSDMSSEKILQLLSDCINKVKEGAKKDQARELRQSLGQRGEELTKNLERFMNIQNERRKLKNSIGKA